MTRATGIESALRHDRIIVLAALGALALGAWLYMIREARAMNATGICHCAGMAMSGPDVKPWAAGTILPLFLMWAEMMVAMMIPSAAPMILLDDRRNSFALQLDVEERSGTSGLEDLGERRDTNGRQLPDRQFLGSLGAPLDALQGGVVQHDRGSLARSPDIEFQAIAGGNRQRSTHRDQRILGSCAPVSPMRQAKGTTAARGSSRSGRHAPTRIRATRPKWSDG